jgi:sulfonate transport system ATP-binding protein
VIGLFLLWQAASSLGWANAYLLPPPTKVARAACLAAQSGELGRHIAASGLRVAEGFSLAVLFALPLAVRASFAPRLSAAFDPLMTFLRNIPPLALVPVLILWFGIGEPSKLALILLSSFFVEGREIRALDGVDLELAEGELATIVGPSGSGKTTLLRIAAGLEGLDSGSVSVSEGTRLGFVFQEPRLLSSLTVEGNVALGLGSGKGRAEGESRVRETLETLGLSAFRAAYPRQLSGGIAQRASLARALVREPDLLLMDEPFSALDAPLRRRLQDELLTLLKRRRASVLFVTHDIGEALYLGDRILGLVDSWASTLGEGYSPGLEEDSA